MKETDISTTNPEAREDLARVRNLATLMDSQFRIPGTDFRFGLDPILGLIPGAGDVVSYVISSFLVLLMARHGVKGQVILMMVGNVILDLLVGAIPVLGGIADFGLKANMRNLRLLERHYEEGKYQRSFWNTLGLLLLAMFAVLFLAIWGIVELILWIF